MDERLIDWNFKIKKKDKNKKESAVQSFGDLINMVRRPPEAVHSRKRTILKTGKSSLYCTKKNSV